MTKKELVELIKENFTVVTPFGNKIDLEFLDFGEDEVNLSYLTTKSDLILENASAKYIFNGYQTAEEIDNEGQEAEFIKNSNQKSEEIDNNDQQADNINNEDQEANKIYT